MATENSLKDKNRIPLLTIVVANALVLYLVATANAIGIFGLSALVKDSINALPAGAMFVITSVLVEVLDSKTKARLVFWKWANPLPGARAFSELAHTDDRIDIEGLKRKIWPFPTGPREQNSLWYKLYLALENNPRITQVHRDYLFTRDYTAISMLFLVVGGTAIWAFAPNLHAIGYDIAVIAQYLIVRNSAKHHGERFVTTVLALTAAS
jgi:hypothetical protein